MAQAKDKKDKKDKKVLKVAEVSALYISLISNAKNCGDIYKIYSRFKLMLVSYGDRYGSYPARQIRNKVIAACYDRIVASETLLGGMRKN